MLVDNVFKHNSEEIYRSLYNNCVLAAAIKDSPSSFEHVQLYATMDTLGSGRTFHRLRFGSRVETKCLYQFLIKLLSRRA